MFKLHRAWIEPNLEARIGAHVQAWEHERQAAAPRELEKQPFLTISREFGCEGLPLAQRLVEILNERFRPAKPWVFYDREVLARAAQELHLRREIVESVSQYRRDAVTELFDSILNRKVDEAVVFRKLAEVIRALALHGHAVLVGRGGYRLTQDLKNGLHVRLVAPRDWRVARVATVQQVTSAEAGRIVDECQAERQRFLRTFFVQDSHDGHYFSLVLDNSRFTVPQMAETIFTALAARFGEVLCAA